MGYFSELDIEVMEFIWRENPTKEEISAKYPNLTDEEINNYIDRKFDDSDDNGWVPEDYDGDVDELTEWMDFDPDC